MNAKYRPNKGVRGNPDCTIFVGRLNPQTTEDTLHNVFSYFGSIHELRLVRDIVTGFSKCYAFVEYTKKKDAERAYRDAHKMTIDKYDILVDFEHQRNLKGWVPRRFGGGFGGQKEAGQLRFGGRDRPFKKPIVINKHANFEERDSGSPRDRNFGSRGRDYGSYRDRSETYFSDRPRDSDRDRSDRKQDPDRSRDSDRTKDVSAKNWDSDRRRGRNRDTRRPRSRSRSPSRDK